MPIVRYRRSLIVSGMYDSSTTSILLKGNSYNRGVRAHAIVMEAMFLLQWRAFVQWLSQKGDSRLDETLLIEQVIACLQTLEEGIYVSTAMHRFLQVSVTAVMTPHFFSMYRPNYSRWLLVLPSWHGSVAWESPCRPPGIHFRKPLHQSVNTGLCAMVDWHDPWAVHRPWQQDNWWHHRHQPETPTSGSLVSDVPRTSSNYNSYSLLLYSYFAK